ncbi:MAG: hypothetical protein KF904_20740, partial [Rhodoblastus sp.]|nr:hypothetical protein [Rhodoblastus sp.]
RIIPGESNAAHGWTDGALFIVINRELLDRVADPDDSGAFQELYLTIAHEYAHDNSSTGSHLHGLEFYRRYHDLTIDSDRLKALGEVRALHEGVISGDLLESLQLDSLSPPDAPWRSEPSVLAAIQKLMKATSAGSNSPAPIIANCLVELADVMKSTTATPADFRSYLEEAMETVDPAAQEHVFEVFARNLAAEAGIDLPSIP